MLIEVHNFLRYYQLHRRSRFFILKRIINVKENPMKNSYYTFWNIIGQWAMIIDRAHQMKQNPEKRQRVIRFGIWAMSFGILTLVCACALLLFQFLGTGIFITIVSFIVAFGIGVIGTLISFITAFIYWFCQLSLNRRAFTWISLAVMLGLFLAAALIPLLFFAA